MSSRSFYDDTFDDWLKNQINNSRIEKQSLTPRIQEMMRVAWEGGWDAGKLYGGRAEADRRTLSQ